MKIYRRDNRLLSVCAGFWCLLLAFGCADQSAGTGTGAELRNPCELFPSARSESSSVISPIIINGSECSGRNTPVARLDLFDDEDNRSVCTATMLTPNKAITAAHCFGETIFRAQLILGAQVFNVRNVLNAPQYTGRLIAGRFVDDVAILSLEAPVGGTAINGPFANVSFDSEEPRTDKFYVFGYGSSKVGESSLGKLNPLRAATLKLIGLSEPFLFAQFSDSPEFSGSNVCFGDSGGPVFAVNSRQPKLIAITSTGSNDNCAPGDVAAFTRLNAPRIQEFLGSALGSHMYEE